MKKNILHISTGRNGGAAKSAFLLHNELLNLNLNSNILIADKVDPKDRYAYSIQNSLPKKYLLLMLKKAEFQLSKLHKPAGGSLFSPGLFSTRITCHPAFKSADIIHLHWINQGMMNISQIQKTGKKIIWTLRDMWPLTGGCHYSLNCSRFTSSCYNCPQLQKTIGVDVANILHNRKSKAFSKNNIHWIAVSTWMKQMAKSSRLCKNKKVTVIHNGINCNDFYPVDKQLARKALKLPLNAKIVLIGAQNTYETYKGFSLFHDCLAYVRKDCHFVQFGSFNNSTSKFKNFAYTHLGYLKNISDLRNAYCAADVFVLPSVQEAFGKTVIEAMACGTPVVAFNKNGPRDIIDHMSNGYLSTAFLPKEFAHGINWLLNAKNYASISKNAAKKVKNNFHIHHIAKKYIDYYKNI
ncbi:MAG: glycosyltransferase [Desulfobacteraceae bacterium]|nr:glycosyltransferase [Desulfobacteraceae bacterium]